jgi:DNA-binding beta-propeller fold protein YncE
MWRRLLVTATSGAAILVLGAGVPPGVGSIGALECVTSEITPVALNAIELENGCLDAANDADADAGLKPARTIADAYPIFLGVAVDPDNGKVVMADSARKGLVTYDRAAGISAGAVDQVAKPLADLRGGKTEIGFVAGVALDRARKEKYTVNNDGGDKVVVFDYDATGNVAPKRELSVTHQAWGVALDRARDEMAVTIEINNMIEIYGREATGKAKPRRIIKGDKTGLADPHGVSIDNDHDEILVANHGNWTSLTSFDPDARSREKAGAARAADPASRSERGWSTAKGGRFLLPSIRVFAGNAKGDATPIRVIQGDKTGLNWPMSLDVDTKNNEIAVANSGDSRVLIFRRSDKGNLAPLRAIGGSNTGLSGPMGVAIDNQNDEMWVTNYGDHTALVFARTAVGNVAPKRIVRNAPAGTPSVGFGNPGAVAYDSKRDEILVPN